MVVVSLSDSRTGNVYREFGRTEVINDNLNPDFVKPINVPFYFEEVQSIRFDVYVFSQIHGYGNRPGHNADATRRYDVDDKAGSNLSKQDFIGFVQSTVGNIVGAGRSKPLQVSDLKSPVFP